MQQHRAYNSKLGLLPQYLQSEILIMVGILKFCDFFPTHLRVWELEKLKKIWIKDGGSEHNYKKWPVAEKSYFFPSDVISAEDPDWDRVGITPPSLAAR